MNGRRELTTAVLGAVGSGALALIAGGQAWAQVTAEREAPLPPVTAVLTSASARRAVASTSAISRLQASGSRPASLPASSAFSAISDSEWPNKSCRSREIRSRSAMRAMCSTSSCLRSSCLREARKPLSMIEATPTDSPTAHGASRKAGPLGASR